ncbi:MAG: 2-oxoglutarate dehydrogenase complex dihydrolipoyllysine-residue succinyltransferase [Bacteroidetes bacterium]|jgi:2-oxoglutarate dehydrogenase E2 component (dihydrolipoamide succinyltransferase)|nr:2-oxoglutarate dehydrogenase complex dihydrolipoyllysine-residue succinyltransferase [Bacteroidota bacterium]
MAVEIKIPSPGESITEVEIGEWLVEEGDFVEKDQEIGEIESDKATLPLIAEDSGKVSLKYKAGDTVKVGAVVCTIDTDQKGEPKKPKEEKKEGQQEDSQKDKKEEKPADKPEEKAKPSNEKPTKEQPTGQKASEEAENVKISPLAKKLMEEKNLSIDDVIKGLRRISKGDVEAVQSLPQEKSSDSSAVQGLKQESAGREESRERMSSLRRKIGQRLVSVKNETAMLTTFNEVDMSKVMEIRSKNQKKFIEKHEVKLGFMSFFTKAAVIALQKFPRVNSMIDNEEMVTPHYNDIGIAVQTDRGLTVPVLRNVETMGLADIEKQIIDLAGKARKGRLAIEDMEGGTFTITNGGIFGSMLSTPILNPPQAAILGMHNIVDRPVAINGQVEIRPMMYIALSYDHRIIDGRESVSFLYFIKELIENPYKMLHGTADENQQLLDL